MALTSAKAESSSRITRPPSIDRRRRRRAELSAERPALHNRIAEEKLLVVATQLELELRREFLHLSATKVQVKVSLRPYNIANQALLVQ